MPYLAIALLGSLALLQASLAPVLNLAGARPDLVLICVICWGILRGPRRGVVWAMVGGIALDLLSAAPFGLYTLPLLVVGLLTALAEPFVFTAGLALPALAAAAGTLIFHTLALLLMAVTGVPTPWLETLRHLTLPTLLANALLAPLVYAMLSWLLQRMGEEPVYA